VFSKFGSCIVGPSDPIPRYGPDHNNNVGSGGDDDDDDDAPTHAATTKEIHQSKTVTSKLDYEVELGIVISSTVPRFTSPSEAIQYIGGYTVVHDVSARDLQLECNGGQWLLGKCGDGYAPLGPVITTLDEFVTDDSSSKEYGGADNLQISCRLTRNNETTTVQSSTTKNLVFTTPGIVSYLSKFVTLHAGDVIATGTPPGVGCFRKPEPLWLMDGDVVECEIEGIGVIRNEVVSCLEGEGGEEDKSSSSDVNATSVMEIVPSEIGPLSGTTREQRLKGSVAIVTGGARGLGYGIASNLAVEGAALVVLLDINQSEIDEAVAQLTEEIGVKNNAKFVGFACDVTNTEQVASTVRHIATISPTGRIDILVQSAGVVGQTNLKTHEVQPSNFDLVMSVNVKGIFNGCQAVIPYMLKQKYGRIINIASIAGKEGNAGMLAYSTSKAAVIGLTKTIGKEYALDGITCNAIAPAVVRTKMVADMPEAQVTYMTDKIPMKRCGKVEEIAALACYIASEDAGFTTGFCWDATGGRSVY
jgi:3-oxoacyl-[acyl-carrier protein] reductase